VRNGWRVLHRHPLFGSGSGAVLLNEGLTLIFISVVLFISWLCYRYVELPAQRWLNAFFDRPARPVPAALPTAEVA
jgi:peptidoglycan/LPS O-acetylase OafA/YrhL